MADFSGKELYKILWLPGETSVIYRMKDDAAVDVTSAVFNTLQIYIDLEKWKRDYSEAYHQWLENDVNDIYDLNNIINKRVLDAIKKHNDLPSNTHLFFFWFDVDRTFEKEGFQWSESPISGHPLIELGKEYHFSSRLISIEDGLVFPSDK